jgi:hypothetical protein
VKATKNTIPYSHHPPKQNYIYYKVKGYKVATQGRRTNLQSDEAGERKDYNAYEKKREITSKLDK